MYQLLSFKKLGQGSEKDNLLNKPAVAKVGAYKKVLGTRREVQGRLSHKKQNNNTKKAELGPER